MTDTMLADALRVMFAEVISTGRVPKHSDVAALPLVTEGLMTRRVIGYRIRDFCYGLINRRDAGESPEQLDGRIQAATQKIVAQDSGTT